MRYTNSARPIIGILDESTLMTLITQIQLQCPALFNWATAGFCTNNFLRALPPQLAIPIVCAQSVTDAVWKNPDNPDLSYLATMINPSMIDLSKAPAGVIDILNEINVCLQIEKLQVNFHPVYTKDALPASIQPYMKPQCVLLRVRLWVGLMFKAPTGSMSVLIKPPFIYFPLDLYAIGELWLVKGENDLKVDVGLKAVEIVGLGPDDLNDMIKAYALQTVSSLIKANAAQLLLPNDLLSINILKDLLHKEGEDIKTDRPSLIIRISFNAQIKPSGAGSPEIDNDHVRIVLVPSSMSEEVI